MEKNAVLYYVYYCVYWYTYEYPGNLFVYNIGERFHVNFLGYAHWFMSIIISHMKDHSISVYKARSATSIVTKYLDIVTVNTITKFYDASTSDKQVEKFTREFNIHYRTFIV